MPPGRKSLGHWHWQGEHFLGSDASPMLEYTKEVVYINDYELAIVKPDELILKTWVTKNNSLRSKLDIELAAIEKGGYEHFMLKEIFEQPQTIYDCLREDWMRLKVLLP